MKPVMKYVFPVAGIGVVLAFGLWWLLPTPSIWNLSLLYLILTLILLLTSLFFKRNSKGFQILFLIFIALTFIIITLVIFDIFYSKTFVMRHDSMSPCVKDKDVIVIERTDKDISRWDILVIKDTERNEFIAKRVIGLPGETVRIGNGRILINGEPIEIPKQINITFGEINDSGQEIPKVPVNGYYYVIGDNLPKSYDSRHFGAVPAANIVGKVISINKKKYSPVNY